MNIKTERKDGILVITPDGRLDAFEATNLEKEIRTAIKDEDCYLVLDMEKVQYLSSGGIRVLIMMQKELKKRNGEVYLCHAPEYISQVLKMTGVDTLFTTYQSVDEAISHSKIQENMKTSQMHLEQLPQYHKHDMAFRIYQSTTRPASLKIVGNLSKVLHATLEPGDIKSRYFSDTEYSIGLGALGSSLDDCFRLLGEMITIGGTMVWLPTDGHDTPDFLIPQKDTGAIVIYTGLNTSLDGEFNDIMVIESTADNTSISISDIYDAIFDIARDRQIPSRSLVSISLIADLNALYSSGVKISPVKEFAPANGGLIMDPENVNQWMNINTQPKYRDKTMISFGMGIDLSNDLSYLDKDSLDNLFYLHPANTGNKKMMLHNHGVVFEQMKWQPDLGLDNEIKRIVRTGEFLDMRHLLDNTRITRAVAGVSYITAIAAE